MRPARLAIALGTLALMTGCYNARVQTGLPPSNTVIKKSFAACWIYGLVPPSTVETQAMCPNGVAIVETKLSFLNMLVGDLTFGIFTPMSIEVTCAEKSSASLFRPGSEMEVSMSASGEEARAVFSRAADQAVRTGKPVAVFTIP